MTTGKKPDYRMSAIDKTRDRRLGNIGSGWKNDDGSIIIKLNSLVVLREDQDLAIRLFPNNNGATTQGGPSSPMQGSDPLDKDIPF